jgi:phosphoribosylamine--glycine ligase
MNILVIGGGGREHALVWKLRQSAAVKKLWCTPGNAGIAQDAECLTMSGENRLAPTLVLIAVAERLKPDLTLVGPEGPLVVGIVDEFEKRGLAILGPTKAAAQLEGSKVFAKEFMERHGIPTAGLYGIHDSAGAAYSALCAVDWPMVIKADGLCAGKGVMVAASPDEATAFIERLMDKKEFGDAGAKVVLEEALEGEELSYIVMTDGQRVVPLVPTRDHKRALDGDRGPNTGGMGAYSSDELLSAELEQNVLDTIVFPTIHGLAAEGRPYKGFLYFGLMLTADGPKVLEFNCRLGDPETQAIVMRMDFDLAAACQAVAQGDVAAWAGAKKDERVCRARWSAGASACVVMASSGYPGAFATGKRIEGLDSLAPSESAAIFHAGTRREGDALVTSGGRVLGVSARGRTLREAVDTCYTLCGQIQFEGAFYRRDIAARFLASARGAAW